MASITRITNKNGTTSYRVTWRAGSSEDGGQRRQEYKSFDNYEEARAYSRKMEETIESKRVGTPKAQTVFGYLDIWIKGVEHRVEREDLSPKTLEGYTRNIGIFKRSTKDQRLSRLNRSDINAAYNKMLDSGLSRQTIVHVHSALHTALAEAVLDRALPENPASFAKPPKAQGKRYKRKVRSFTRDEVERQLHLAPLDKRYGPDTYLIALILAICGLRRGELCGLAFDAIDFEGAKISIHRNVLEVNGETKERNYPKTDASVRTISIPAALVELLRQHQARVARKALQWGKDYKRKPMYLFPGPGGVAMSPKLVTTRMTRLALKAGVDMTNISPCHSWRHTSGSLLWAATKDVKAVQTRLGHSNPAITMALYVHNVPAADEAAAEHLGKLIK